MGEDTVKQKKEALEKVWLALQESISQITLAQKAWIEARKLMADSDEVSPHVKPFNEVEAAKNRLVWAVLGAESILLPDSRGSENVVEEGEK